MLEHRRMSATMAATCMRALLHDVLVEITRKLSSGNACEHRSGAKNHQATPTVQSQNFTRVYEARWT